MGNHDYGQSLRGAGKVVMMSNEAKSGDMRIEYVPLSDVKEWPKNPKRHSIADIGASIEEHGFNNPLLVDEGTGMLVAGHGRLETLSARRAVGEDPPARIRVRDDGEWLVPVVRGVEFKSKAAAEAFLLADNRITEAGGWDKELLADMMRGIVDLSDDGDAVPITGFSQEEVDRLVELSREALEPEEAREYDETIAGDVEMIECPSCKHEFPR